MSDDTPIPTAANDPLEELRTRADVLERELTKVRLRAEAHLIRSEMKAEALRAGIVDLDGLKLIDASEVKLDADGQVEGVAVLITQLRKAKPWLFATGSASSTAIPPPAQAPGRKLATEMTDAEYRIARQAVVKSRG